MRLNINPGSDLDLDEMDKPSRESPVLADTVPVNKSRLGVPSSLLPYSPTAAAFSSGWFSTLAMTNLIPRNLDDVLVSDWIDAMSSSSPPRKKHSKDFTNDPSSIEDLSAYKLWTRKYPSALTLFEHITSQAEGKKIALFLDYDGTLSPIVNDPDSAVMSKKMRAAVKSVAEYFPTAIISGRSRDKVYELVGLTELYYAGSHGMDIMGPVTNSVHQNCTRTTDRRGKESHLFQPASNFLPTINEVFRTLVDCTKGIKGAKVENNKFCLSVHYRLVDKKSWPVVMQIVQDVLKDHPNLRLTYGRKVLEIRPVIDWDKGKAVLFLLQSLRLTDPEDVLPIYIGDDRTDEDAFNVLKEKNHGYGILVSSVPKESRACYSLKDPSEVLVFLKSLVRWRRSFLTTRMNKYNSNQSQHR